VATTRSTEVFEGQGHVFFADSCEPLKAAAARGEVEVDALSRGSYPGRPLMPRELPEVRSVGFWDASRSQIWGLNWHRNEGIEITYVARGSISFAVDGQELPLQQGDLTITRPWQVHRVGNPHVAASRLFWLILDVGVRRPHQPWEWPSWLIFPSKMLRALTTLLQQNEQPVWRANAKIEVCFEKIAMVMQDPSVDVREVRLKLYINDLLLELLELLERKNIALDESLNTSRRSVEMFLDSLVQRSGERWDLNSMAQECCLGRSRFAHYCKQITNMTPIEYLTHCRLQAAAALLRGQKASSITEVAYTCGFETSQYFATVFRSNMGVSPSEFRDGIQKDPAPTGY
jgi:AraC-like DNA-binding protein